jgi:hypothetical protein
LSCLALHIKIRNGGLRNGSMKGIAPTAHSR